jgi:DHA2 family multidrug resistance protein
MFCLLPPTRLALGQLSATEIPDASGLFNLMRNLGGAIGLALLDSVIYGRAPINAQAIVERLQAGDVAVLKALGVPVELFAALPSGSMDPGAEAVLAPAIHRLALAQAVNQAWGVLAMVTLLAAACVPLMRYRRLSLDSHSKVDSRPVVMRQ